MIFYRALQPLLYAAFGALAFFLQRIPGIRERTEKIWRTWEIRRIDGHPAFLKIDPSVFHGQRPIWIHAASGEFEYAKPVIRELRLRSDVPILVTYFSPTYADNVARFPGVTASCPLPLDSRHEIDKFLKHLQPQLLLIARTDAWPNTILAVAQSKIPILLFATTFHEKSRRMGLLGRSITGTTLGRIDLIQCVSAEDRKTLQALGLSRIEVAGDTRYDQVLDRLAEARAPKVNEMIELLREKTRPRVFVAGSVWSEDLAPVIQASRATIEATPHALILVPHEVSEPFLNEIEQACASAGFHKQKIVRLSRLSAEHGPIDVVVVDSVGLLAELYLLAEIAFVGGSFRKTVHSVMEPLAAGCLTFVGPLHLNNREAVEFQKLRATNDGPFFVTCVQDAGEFVASLASHWQMTSRDSLKSQIRAEVFKRGGATQKTLRWIEEKLETKP